MEVERKIRKIGNSLGVLLPSDMLKEIGIENGDSVFVSVEDGEIRIRSMAQKQANDKFKEKVIAIIEEYMEEHDIVGLNEEKKFKLMLVFDLME
jgi:antitoxin MazE